MNLLGESLLTLGDAPFEGGPRIGLVEEKWHQSPAEAFFSQVLPKWRDVSSIWCSPTAEHYPLETVARKSGYKLVRVPPMLALQSAEFQSSPLLKQDQAPLPPAYAFTGTVKRSEQS